MEEIWNEAKENMCQDLCAPDCHDREERICDKLTGEDHLKKLMIDWGYEGVLPENKPPEFETSHTAHFITGIIILGLGKESSVANNNISSIFATSIAVSFNLQREDNYPFEMSRLIGFFKFQQKRS